MLDLIKKIIPYIKPYKAKIVGSVLFSFLLAGIKGAQVYLIKPIFDKGLAPNSTTQEMLFLSLALLSLGIINFPARFFHFYWIRYVVEKATCSIRSEIYNKLQKLPLSFYAKKKQGALISNLLSDTQVFSMGFRSSIDIIREPLTAFIMFGLALWRDWQLTLVIALVFPLFVLIFSKSGKKMRDHQGEVQEELSEMTHSVAEGISGQKIAKAFNIQRYIHQRFTRKQDKFFKAQMKTAVVEELAHPLVELVGFVAFSGVIFFAHYRITSNEISTGDFVSFLAALALIMDPIRKYSQANIKLNQASAAGKRIFEILSLQEEKNEGAFDPEGLHERIEFKNVSFSYGEGNGNVLTDVSFTIEKGEKVGLVGLSGSGKSTLINLLLSLYPLNKGEIFIDGRPLSSLKLDSLRSLFALVNQDIFLFNDTILENLTLGATQTYQNIEESLKVAYAKGFIDELPQKMETLIGDRGMRLSGGQKQRLTIARAYLRNSDVLLFDEATSALDNESEKIVQRALQDLAGNKTVLAVAHRLSTIQDFDKIIVLKDGRIIEQGTHHELLNKWGEYSKLYELSQRS
jgi:subfamily B ATP-binding cassette protein MsbA